MWGKGKEKGCRFIPLDLPARSFFLKKKDKKKESKKDTKVTTEDSNPYSALSADNEDDDNEEETKKNAAKEKVSAEIMAQVAAQEEQTKIEAAKEAEFDYGSNENEGTDETDSGKKIFADLAEFEDSLQNPHKFVKLDQGLIRPGTDM
jgi:hypothetical protein